VAGALVSIFGKGIRGGSLVTLADSQGQFVLPSLPAGSYTLRAVGSGHEPSAAQRVTVLPNRDALYTLSLTPVGERAQAAAPVESAGEDEWRWLVRHKRRSVLETSGPVAAPVDEPLALTLDTTPPFELGSFDGSVELAATGGGASTVRAPSEGLSLPAGMGSVQLSGRLSHDVTWALGGLLTENEGRAWRVAAEFVIEPGSRHELEVGAGYGNGNEAAVLELGPAEPPRTTGAVFVRDRYRINDRLIASAGVRYTYVGFLPDSNHADAVVEVLVQGDDETVLRGAFATRTLTPGGDLLSLSTVAASPEIAWARLDQDLRAGHARRYELGVDRALGSASRMRTQVFAEFARDALLTSFQDGAPFVQNAGPLGAKGFGVTLGHRFGRVFDGSLTYTFGQTQRGAPVLFASTAPISAFEESEFHDLAARVETFIDWSDTRVMALCRLNSLADSSLGGGGARAGATSTRFDVQLTQGLPFLAPLTRADWKLLLAVRNMFYEASQVGFLDELAVQDPPTRVVGGISVKF
jgi:hypothetical protein